MSIHLPKSNAVFFHIPKTGGTWVHRALEASGIEMKPFIIQPHSTYLEEDIEDKYTFAFVRHPWAWYQSYWRFRTDTGWKEKWWLDDNCRAETFEEFIGKVIDKGYPYLTEMYNNYTGEPTILSFVGKQENLVEDLVHVLRHLNETFDEEKLRNTPRQNVSTIKLPPLDESLQTGIISLEKETMQKWNYH